MTRLRCLSIVLALLAFGMWLPGCGDDNPASGGTSTQNFVVSTSPQDGATNVPTSSSVVMTFSLPMDTLSFMENLHCAGGAEMWEWMDSLQHYGMGPGGHMNNMSHMMDWMRDIQLPGQFHWNNQMTQCVFRPTTALLPQTDYMIYIEDGARSRNGLMMDRDHMQYDGYMVHFRTAP